MEITIRKHKITLFGNIKSGYIFRAYDCKGYVHLVIDLLKNRKGSVVWLEPHKNWKGNWTIFSK